MRQDDREDVFGHVDPLEQLDPGFGVRTHERPLLRREATGLVQDLGRDVDLADVVQQGSDTEPEHAPFLEARAPGERAREVGHPHAVPLRVRVLRFDRFAPLPHDRKEAHLEPVLPAIEVGEVASRPQLHEQLVRAVERLHRLAIAPQARQQLRMLARQLGLQQDVLAHRGERRA